MKKVIELWFCDLLGGVRKVSGINYVDDSEIPKRSRQLIWRAAVERSKNAAQLALQVCHSITMFE